MSAWLSDLIICSNTSAATSGGTSDMSAAAPFSSICGSMRATSPGSASISATVSAVRASFGA
eukprot:796011-Prorocentrum_minimum.AAC.1